MVYYVHAVLGKGCCMREIHHLTLKDRQTIQAMIEEGKNKAEIARCLAKDPCGISREIIKQREFRERNKYNRPILCAKRKWCKSRCSSKCNDFEEPVCKRRDRLPGVCNGCEKRARCPLDKYFYHAARADSRYREKLASCREGINLAQSERDMRDNFATFAARAICLSDTVKSPGTAADRPYLVPLH
jgi:hypothetical protein